MGDKIYVEEHFGQAGKTLAEEMIVGIKDAFKNRLEGVEFMDEDTRDAALLKLEKMRYMVGYPDENWPEYPDLEVGDSFLLNTLSSERQETRRELQRMSEAVDPDRWQMNPSEVNAYYAPTKNLIAFPAGVLQPPFFSSTYPMVLNYASIGAIMGHEITHGFDHMGAQYDDEGKLTMWWTNTSIAGFHERIGCVVNQYSSMPIPELAETMPDAKINGELTVGENVADTGGVLTALEAYRTWKASHNDTAIAPDSFQVGGETMSDEQVFWLAYGQSWCALQDPNALMVQLNTDPHSPGRARTNGPAQNSLAFAEAFGCEATAPMNPETKCAVWEPPPVEDADCVGEWGACSSGCNKTYSMTSPATGAGLCEDSDGHDLEDGTVRPCAAGEGSCPPADSEAPSDAPADSEAPSDAPAEGDASGASGNSTTPA